MIHVEYSLTCDSCNKRQFSHGNEDEAQTLLDAQVLGWRIKKVRNGSMWHFCPTCVIQSESYKEDVK